MTNLLEIMAKDLIATLDPAEYLKSLEYKPYRWQVFVLNAIKRGIRRIIINGARQAGKSTIVSGVPAYVAKNERALSLIYAPSIDQAADDIERCKEFIYRDETYPELKLDSVEHIKLPNGSYIKANTATAKTKRGKSKPRVIIFDEASQIGDSLYKTVRPMLTDNPDCILIAISTPYGRSGWYWKAWNSERWLRVMVKAPWEVEDGVLLPAAAEAEFAKTMRKKGIYAFYSPRHLDKEFMLEELEEHKEQWFRQEYLCEFVEPDEQVFSYEEIEKMFRGAESKSLSLGDIGDAPGRAIEIGL